jgi:predicted acyl esterase
MPINTTTQNVFGFSPDVQLQLEALVSGLMQLGTGGLDSAPEGLEDLRRLQGLATFAPVKIPGADAGVILDAGIVVPLGPGPHPVVILPGPLAATGWKSYPGMLIQLGLRGYIALAYTERGLGDSTGLGDVAGERDRADGSRVIDWVLANYPQADPTRIGFAGSSYGAGQSLLIAAHDRRVAAVCAQSAWADLERSILENDTPHVLAANELAKLFADRLSSDADRMLEDLRNNRITEAFRAFCRVRSPVNYLAALNDRRVPIFLGTYWHETIFSVPAVVEFFNRLTGPRRLLVQIGDHGGGEVLGFLGGFSRPTATSYEWLDQFVKNRGRGAMDDTTVHTEHMYMNLVEPIQKAPSWEAYVLPAVRYYLDAPAPGQQDGTLSARPGSGGTQEFAAGVDTPAMVAPALVQTGMMERLGRPVEYETATISREDAAVWSTQPFTTAQQITGSLALHLVVTPSAPTATLVAYLFDLDPGTGIARIITSAPYTLLDEGPNRTRTIDIPLQPADYRVAAGHRLQLVVDTKDRFFTDVSVAGTKIKIATSSGGAYLQVPIRAA